MSGETVATGLIAVLLLVLLLLTLRESFSKRIRERFAAAVHGIGAAIDAVHRFFVKPQEKKEVPSEPTL